MARALILIDALNANENRDRALATARLHRSFGCQAAAMALTDVGFRTNYRLSKPLFEELCSDLRPLMPTAQRHTKLSLECKVCIIVIKLCYLF